MKFFSKYVLGAGVIFVAVFFVVLCKLVANPFFKTKSPELASDVLSAGVCSEKKVSKNWYIFTGGPGTGKTSVLNELAKRGYAIITEAATTVIAQELEKGEKTPWSEPWFEVRVAEIMAQRQDALERTGAPIAFFDRGPVDPISYIFWYRKPINQQAIAALNSLLLNDKISPTVFVFEDLGVCENTVIRHETVKEMRQLEDRLIRDYESLGFTVIRVPRASIKERADFILAQIAPFLMANEPESTSASRVKSIVQLDALSELPECAVVS